MPPAVAAFIATAVKVATAVVAAYKASVIVRGIVLVAAMIGSSLLSKALAKKPGKIQQGQEIKFKVDPSMPRQIPVGVTATGGSWTFAFTWTDDTKIPNKYLVRVISISDVPVEGLLTVLENGNELTWDQDPNTDFATCVQHRRKSGGHAMWCRFVKGSWDPAGAEIGMRTYLVEKSGGKWTHAHKGVGQAYAVMQYMYDADAFPQGEPALTFVVKGAKCYDDRKDGSKPGRTGTHRLNDPNTWEFTENAAIIAAQVLRGFYHGDQLIMGAQAQPRDLDDGMLIAAYNTCDQLVPQAEGDPVPRYRAGMMLTASESIESILEDLEVAMDGNIYDRGGQITILPGGSRTPVYALNDDNVIWTEESSWQPKEEVDNLFNAVSGTFVSGEDGFIEKPFPPLVNPTWEADDGGERLYRNLSYRAVVYATQVQRTNTRIWKSSRYQGTLAIVLPLECLELEQGDWFTFASSRWDFTTKYFEVVSPVMTTEFRYGIIAKEVHPDIDGWDPVVEEIPDSSDYYQPTDPGLPIPELEVSAVTITNADNSLKLPAINVKVLNITENSNVQSVDYQYGYYIGPTLTNVRSLGMRPASEHEFQIVQGIIPNYTFAVRARSYNGKRYSTWSTYYTTNAPPDFVVPDSTKFGGKTSAEWVDIINEVGGIGDELAAQLAQLEDTVVWTPEAIWGILTRESEIKDRLEKMLHHIGPNGEPIPLGTRLAQEIETRTTNDTAYNAIFNVLGAWTSPAHEAWLLNTSTVMVTPTMSFTQYTQAQISEFDNVYATIQTVQTTTATAIDALAEEVHIIGVKIPGQDAFLIDVNKAFVSPGQSMASKFLGLSAEIDTKASAARASAVTETKAYVDNQSAFAQVLTQLNVNYNGFIAKITEFSQADSTFGARAGLRLDVNGHVTGYIANNDGFQGGFVFVGDYFAIATPGGVVNPFYVIGSTVYMGNVIATQIQAGIVTADKIVGGAVTSINQDGSGAVQSFTGTHIHFTMNVTSEGGTHLISVTGEIGSTETNGDKPIGGVIQTLVDGFPAGPPLNIFCPGAWGGETRGCTFAYTPGAGNHSISIQYTKTPGSFAGNIKRSFVTSAELKK